MAKFIITGKQELSGEINVSGAKNAVLPLMAACLLTEETCTLTNVPAIKDVESMASILKDLGAEVIHEGDRLTITAGRIVSTVPKEEVVKKIRASILIAGPLLGRCGEVTLPFPGGDKIGARPLDAHLSAFRDLGARVEMNGIIKVSADHLSGNKIVLEETSVTGTENALMAAVLAKGTTMIKLAAMEPHVQQLAEFLNMMGARITGIGSPTLMIEGVHQLHGATIAVIPDSEEAASLLTLAAATKSNIVIKNVNPDFLEDYLLKLRKMNVQYRVGVDSVEILKPNGEYVGTKIQCGFYPKLNSDYLPPMSVLATQATGETVMYEWLYEDRLGHIAELKKMGAQADILDPHRVKIIGPTQLHGTEVTSYDLRMGMTLVIAGLMAEGETIINGIEHIDRGYANIEERLRALGAKIERV